MKSGILNLTIFLIAMFTFSAHSATVESDFDSANRLYEQGKFEDAASAYENMIRSGVTSGSLYFNLGDAYFKSGQIGKSIVAYRHASQLTPRDQDLQANLQFVRNQVSGPTLKGSRWQSWLTGLTLNEWTWLTVGTFWVLFLIMTARQWRPQWQQALRTYILGAAVLLVIFVAGLGFALAQRFNNSIAVVIKQDTVVRNGTFEGSPERFKAQDGAELQVLDHKDNWYQVSDGAGRIGWVKNDSVDVVPVM